MHISEIEDLLLFLRAAYPDNARQSDRDHWEWHYLQNPYAGPENIPVWLAKCDEKIVGQLAAIPVELNVLGSPVTAIWVLDLIVDPEFRRRGIMKALFRL